MSRDAPFLASPQLRAQLTAKSKLVHGCPDSLEQDLERVRNGPSVGGSFDGFENGPGRADLRAAARDCGTTNYFSGWVTVELDGHEQRLALAAGRHGAREHLAGDAVVDAHGVAGPRAIGHVGAPHCLQNRPWTGAPHAVQKFCPVGGGGGMIGSHASAGVAGTGWPAVMPAGVPPAFIGKSQNRNDG